MLSAACANEARQAVLSFFRAPPGYTVVFTANATGALKLVGESFPFADGSSYVLGADSHNSVHGIRKFATARGADVRYIASFLQHAVYLDAAKKRLCVLGEVNRRFVVTPDLDALLSAMELADNPPAFELGDGLLTMDTA